MLTTTAKPEADPSSSAGRPRSASTHGAEGIYLDHAATAPLDPSIAAAMNAVASQHFGNPSSRHALGLAAERQLRQARAQIARRLGLVDGTVVFTSGATEALAIAILGSGRARRQPGHVLVSAVEHAAVRENALLLARDGHEVEEIPVDADGRIQQRELLARLRPETFLVCVMHANNEVGVVQPIGRVARAVKRERPRCRILVDMVQSFGVLDTDVAASGVDMVAVSAHKLHGPKGVGALGLAPGVSLPPLWAGGGQEHGLRAGTENVAGAVGFGLAAEAGKGDPERFIAFGERLLAAVREVLPDARALVDPRHRAPHILAVTLPGLRSEVVVNALSERGLWVSSGSACHSRRSLRSRVLTAMGVDERDGVIRLSFGRSLDDDRVDRAAELLRAVLAELS
ncbi:MAG: cysteine desulfurase NifS [Deltaproteobacteria bacterium]|nr:MAG: cysteine desulfurase NifS [Deltaproteobacteria bacterium]